jgi:hypothetical protein
VDHDRLPTYNFWNAGSEVWNDLTLLVDLNNRRLEILNILKLIKKNPEEKKSETPQRALVSGNTQELA